MKRSDFMKTCRNCKQFKGDEEFCKIHIIRITDKTVATYCKKYEEKRHLHKGKVKCTNCLRLNRYGWCGIKKICLNEEEKIKERSCIKFIKKKIKKAKTKKK